MCRFALHGLGDAERRLAPHRFGATNRDVGAPTGCECDAAILAVTDGVAERDAGAGSPAVPCVPARSAGEWPGCDRVNPRGDLFRESRWLVLRPSRLPGCAAPRPTGAILDVRVSAAKDDEPLVVLRPGGFGDWTPLTPPPVESAYVTYDWLNWCGAQGAVGFRVSLPNGRGTLDAPFISHAATVVGAPGAKPRCDAPDGSFMGVGPFHFSDDLS